MTPKPALSIVVVSYNMAREIPRTLYSLSSSYQRGMRAEDYEVILVDNCSDDPLDEEACRRILPGLRLHCMPRPSPTPVDAVNRGLELAAADKIGVVLDGARLASPGLLKSALAAFCLDSRPVVATLSFHLGPDVQRKSVACGYNRREEDRLLLNCRWQEDGYRLFTVSTLASSSARGWFLPPAESNALFMTATQWKELGGYDPGFCQPGGGLVNLDTWVRACEKNPHAVIMLLGEATFHQLHGGASTNAKHSTWEPFHREYIRLRGKPFEHPRVRMLFYGSLDPLHAALLQHSSEKFRDFFPG